MPLMSTHPSRRLVGALSVCLTALLAVLLAAPAARASHEKDKIAPKAHIVLVQLGSKDNTMRFFPGDLVLKKGERYKLVLSNPSPVTHEFASERFRLFVETEKIEVFDASGDKVAYVVGDVKEVELLPGGTIVWIFTARRTSEDIDLFCDIPGHRDAGMVGRIEIQE